MKLTLKQKGLRQFTVLFHRKNVHSFYLPEDESLAYDRIYQILDETAPTQDPVDFFDGMHDAGNSLFRAFRDRHPTSFYCGAMCLTLEK